MSDRVATLCDQCGQTDTHPKAHVGLTTKHHDCLSHSEEQQLVQSGQEKGQPKASAVIEACKGGTKGDDLLALIQSGDLPKATGKGGRNNG
jgi:hypothetical protein